MYVHACMYVDCVCVVEGEWNEENEVMSTVIH